MQIILLCIRIELLSALQQYLVLYLPLGSTMKLFILIRCVFKWSVTTHMTNTTKYHCEMPSMDDEFIIVYTYFSTNKIYLCVHLIFFKECLKNFSCMNLVIYISIFYKLMWNKNNALNNVHWVSMPVIHTAGEKNSHQSFLLFLFPYKCVTYTDTSQN